MPRSGIQTFFYERNEQTCLLCEQVFDHGNYGGPILDASELSVKELFAVENLLAWWENFEKGTAMFVTVMPVIAVESNTGLGYIHVACFEKHVKQLKEAVQ